jgi:hypothetical protein
MCACVICERMRVSDALSGRGPWKEMNKSAT